MRIVQLLASLRHAKIIIFIIHSKYFSVSDWLSITGLFQLTGYHRPNLVNRPITEKLLDDWRPITEKLLDDDVTQQLERRNCVRAANFQNFQDGFFVRSRSR